MYFYIPFTVFKFGFGKAIRHVSVGKVFKNIVCNLRFQAQAKFDIERAQTALDWAEQMIGQKLDYPEGGAIRDSLDFGAILKDGTILCQ